MPELPKIVAYGAKDVAQLVPPLRDMHDYLRLLPAFELVERVDRALKFPFRMATDIKLPRLVYLNVQTFPDDGTAVTAPGPSWRYDANRKEIVFFDIAGLTAGNSYRIAGLIFGERV